MNFKFEYMYVRGMDYSTRIKILRLLKERFGELRISEARYEDLLSEADEEYPKYLSLLRKLDLLLHINMFD